MPDREPSQSPLTWAFLQPYAEYLADYIAHPPLHETPSVCPLGSGRPLVGVLWLEGDGRNVRSFALCLPLNGVSAGLSARDAAKEMYKSAVYSAKEITHVRVEAFDKTIDLMKNGNALPWSMSLRQYP